MSCDEGAIERIAVSDQAPHVAVEAAIHLTRYGFVQTLCPERRVLDVACGEGYGSYLMGKRWRAHSVVGVDISHSAIASARTNFPADNVDFRAMPIADIVNAFDQDSFDLAVCLETLEHVEDPVNLLEVLRRVVTGNGFIVISCPNDHWYYPRDSDSNPYHVRKYSELEFRDLTESVLGPASAWYRGAPVSGFINVPTDLPVGTSRLGGLLMRLDSDVISVVPPDQYLSEFNVAYFLGVWGPPEVFPEIRISGSIFPTPMDSTDVGIWRQASLVAEEHQRALLSQASLIDERDAYIKHLEQLVRESGLARSKPTAWIRSAVSRIVVRSRGGSAGGV